LKIKPAHIFRGGRNDPLYMMAANNSIADAGIYRIAPIAFRIGCMWLKSRMAAKPLDFAIKAVTFCHLNMKGNGEIAIHKGKLTIPLWRVNPSMMVRPGNVPFESGRQGSCL